jgi:hypothetical protein
MSLRPDHYTKYTIPPVDSELMLTDDLWNGELGIVVENMPRLIVELVSTGELVELMYRNNFNVISVPG